MDARDGAAFNVIAGWLDQPTRRPRRSKPQKPQTPVQRIKQQKKQRAIRRKYGPLGKPSPVIVRKLDTGDVIKIVSDPKLTIKQSAYEVYLQSAHWRRFRKHARRMLRYECPCGARTELHLHHLTYERLGCESLNDVAWLCGPCHRNVHRR